MVTKLSEKIAKALQEKRCHDNIPDTSTAPSQVSDTIKEILEKEIDPDPILRLLPDQAKDLRDMINSWLSQVGKTVTQE